MNPDDDCGYAHLAAGWIVGTLTPDEAQRFAAHLSDCATCRAEVADLREAADAMADAVPPAAPPPRLRRRLMATVRGEADLFRAAGARGSDRESIRRPRRRRRHRILLAAAAMSLIVGGTVLGGLLAGPEDRRPQSRTFRGVVTLPAGGPAATATILVRGDEAKLVLSDMEGPPDGQIYQAWLERPPATPVPTGALFSVGASGGTTISLPQLRAARRVIVTSEPASGSTIPTLPAVVVVDLAAPGQTSR
ncbi:MAG: anti-sigma factor [Actinomycetota bacterium]|nr:anti-sigma factor [Actinomycetota bacterium]